MIYIGYKSALKFWRTADDGIAGALPRITPKSGMDGGGADPCDIVSTNDLEKLDAIFGKTGMYDIVIFNPNLRRHRKKCRYHEQCSPLPAGSFLRITDNIAVACPELTFLQMAEEISLLLLIKYGMELCGTYSLGLRKGDALTIRNAPHTTAARLKEYLDRATGKNKAKEARRAASYVLDMSASPRETVVVMILCLPPKLGGFGLRWPQLNLRVDFDETAKQISGLAFARCDLCWADHKLALEVDSSQYHSSFEQIMGDRSRSNAIEHVGYRMIHLTNDQLMNFDTMACIASDIAKILGMRITTGNPEIDRKRRELHRMLLYAENEMS